MMYDAYEPDDDFAPVSQTVAWQEHEGGKWSKTHRTHDGGRTTLCGARVPDVNWMSDSTSSMGACKRCINAKNAQ